ncbi:MAG: PAS domain S-box protein [Candidatus Bathyarchaeota archaeon]|nr:PAS domain S-box protein [Candidatus Bathyarchaeota archaeon]
MAAKACSIEYYQSFESLLEAIPIPAVIIDLTGKVVAVNELAERYTSYKKEEILGRTILEQLFLDREEKTRLIENFKKRLQGKNIPPYETQFKLKNGEIRFTEITAKIIVHENAIFDLALFTNITERKKAIQELADSKHHIENMFNLMYTGVVVIDAASHQIVDANKMALQIIGASKEAVLGKECHNFICPTQKGKCPITDCGLEVDSQERIILTANGKRVPILKSVVKAKIKEKLLLVESFVDISDRKKLEELTVKAERLSSISDLSRQLGHDLRNPLAAIKNCAYFLEKKGDTIDAEQREDILKTINLAIDDADRIVTSLIEYSGEVVLHPKQCTPKTLIQNALSKLKVPQTVRIQDKTRNEPTLLLDAQKIEKVFLNILQNSIQAIPQKGTIWVNSKVEGTNIQFTFKDQGVGIPEELQRRLFSPLITTKAKGMGMGLAISKRIVDAHKGKISFKSAVGKGTTFSVTLPCAYNRNSGVENVKKTSPKTSFTAVEIPIYQK